MRFLNNAATSFPKPEAVTRAVAASLAARPMEPGRSRGGKDLVSVCRERLATLFGVDDPAQVILVPSATYGLNLVIHGVLTAAAPCHVLATQLEHNSVLRPLAHAARRAKVEVTHLTPTAAGEITAAALADAIRPQTRLVAVTHASNVSGSIQPVAELAAVAARAQIPLLLDASQTAGAVPLSYRTLPGRVFLVAAGHKGLYGPTGTGVLVVPDALVAPTFVGGTGVRSEELLQPETLPLYYEAGTHNLPGAAGLAAGVEFVLERGVETLGQHRHDLVTRLRERLQTQPGITLQPIVNGDGRAGVVSFTVAGVDPDEVGLVLSESFDIETRSGLHCAPLAHRHFKTLPRGTVRASFAAFNTNDDVEALAAALAKLGRR